jgi:hypothetical protein
MVKIFDADLVKDHFIINDDGKRALLDTGCPHVINDENKNSIPMGDQYLQDARRDIDPSISEFRGLEYFAQRKVLFDYRRAAIIVADQGDDVSVMHPIAEFAISGLPDRIVFSAGSTIDTELFQNFQVLVDCENRRLVLGKYE